MLNEDELGAWFEQHLHRSAFRLELLPAYAVDSDGEDYRRWLAGEAEPTWSRKNEWLDVLREDAAAGRSNSRVKVMSPRPTDYERYAADWGYRYNAAAGEDIGILDLATTHLPDALAGLRDFWLVDGEHVMVMHYDEHGRFDGGEPAPAADLPRYVAAQNAAQAAAEPFTQWWSRRTDLHRGRQVA